MTEPGRVKPGDMLRIASGEWCRVRGVGEGVVTIDVPASVRAAHDLPAVLQLTEVSLGWMIGAGLASVVRPMHEAAAA